MQTIFRTHTYAVLTGITLQGRILDLGGMKNAEYHSLFSGTHQFEVANIDPKAHPDCLVDLEMPLPMTDAQYDGVVLLNVMEHIFSVQALLRESYRVIKSGGTVVAVVPFVFPVHPSPNDFFRFTHDALERLFGDAGFVSVKVTPIGTGVFAARHLLISRLYPRWLAAVVVPVTGWWAQVCDSVFARIARGSKKGYRPEHYPLGYCVEAKK